MLVAGSARCTHLPVAPGAEKWSRAARFGGPIAAGRGLWGPVVRGRRDSEVNVRREQRQPAQAPDLVVDHTYRRIDSGVQPEGVEGTEGTYERSRVKPLARPDRM